MIIIKIKRLVVWHDEPASDHCKQAMVNFVYRFSVPPYEDNKHRRHRYGNQVVCVA